MDPPRSRLTGDDVRSALDLLGRDFCRPLQALRRALGDVVTDRPVASAGLLAFVCDDLLHLPEAFREHALLVHDERPARPEWTTLQALLDRAEDGFAAEARARGFAWVATLDGPDTEVAADPAVCLAVLSRLVANALSYVPTGTAIRVSAGHDASEWWMSVSDDGPGVPAGERERVFEPFHRLSREARGAVPGAGLGLATCRILAGRMGGSLALDEPSGAGVRVTARFPRVPIT